MTRKSHPPADFDSAPDCPTCEIPLEWDEGQTGNRETPDYDPGWDCPECGGTWNEDGPSNADYANAELARQEAAEELAA